MSPRTPARRLVLVLLACLGAVSPARAQVYARFAVPDSARVAAVRGSGGGYERAWNALLVSEIRATLARADSAARLGALARDVARAETAAFGTRIASDAWRLRTAWRPRELRLRVQAAVAESLGQVAQNGGAWVPADSLFRRALAGYREVRESRREAWVLGNLEVVATNAGGFARADSLCRLALAARRAIGDSVMTGNSLFDLGVIALKAGRPGDALGGFTAAAALRERTGETSKRGSAVRGMADARRDLGQRDAALALYAQAIELTSAGGDSARVSEVAAAYGRLLIGAGRPGEGIEVLERARIIAAARGDAAREAVMLDDQAEGSRVAGDFTVGIARLERARTLALGAGDPFVLRLTLLRLGQLWVIVRDPVSARAPLERALALADSLGDRRGVAEAYTDLALARHQEGDPRAAQRLVRRALDTALASGDSALVHDVLRTDGHIAFEQGRLDDARFSFERAIRALPGADVDTRAEDQLDLGSVASEQGRLDDAMTALTLGAALCDSAGLPDVRWRAWLGFGDVAERRGEIGEALAWDRRAASLIDTLRERRRGEGAPVQRFGRRLSAYETLIHLLGKLDPQYPDSGFAAEAFAWSERAKARSFLDAMAAGGESDAAPLTLAAVQREVPAGAALLSYSLGDSSSSLWVMTAKRWRHVVLAPRKTIQARVELLRRALGDPASSDLPATREASRSLYRAVIGPVEAELKRAGRLIVAPDGPLALVPFEALLLRDPRGDGPLPKGSWLVERWPVSVVPSASVLPHLAGGAPGRGIVAVGDPDFGRAQAGRIARDDAPPAGAPAAGSLPRLPNTAAEIVALTSYAGTRSVRVLAGTHATRDSLLGLPELARAGLLHVATHGIASEADPSCSGLWLAASDSTAWPAFLSVGDIHALKLDASLVTLSACETGLGRLERGEGVVGLTRAFLGAGAGSVVVSLWSVNDASTAMLMNAFYRELLVRGAARDVSLARAKRVLLANPETRAPFYWAPFVLVGHSGTLATK